MHHKFIDQYSHLDSLLHRIDPRVKIIVFVAVVCCIVLTPLVRIGALYFYGAMVLVLTIASRLPWRFILKRSLIFLPFIILLSLPMLLKAENHYFEFVVFIVLRSFLALVCMLLLVSTTHFTDLLKGFEKMRCPTLLLMIFSFMYRYYYLFSDQLMKMNRARESRTVVNRWWFKVRALSNMIGSLFVNSYETSEKVYLAMCSRGYRGQIKTTHPFVFKTRDFSFMLIVLAYVSGVSVWSYIYA
ncbi:MAG: cobalt ECF transporter T component CbiQ [Candidatus Omnitrophota bacterium]